MTPVPIDPELIARLTANGGEVPLTDRDGKPVGYFVTPELYDLMWKAYALAQSQVTEEDCRRAVANPKRHTTEEVFELLGGE